MASVMPLPLFSKASTRCGPDRALRAGSGMDIFFGRFQRIQSVSTLPGWCDMSSVFARTSWFAVALLVSTAGLGLWIGDLHGQTEPAVLRWATVHRLSGAFAALTVVLVNSMAFTYFIGTGRWCREVVDAYGLEPSLFERARGLKRRVFPWVLLGMIAVVLAAALGAAADPASGRPGTADWVNVHLLGSLACVALIAFCFQAQYGVIQRQQLLVSEVLEQVGRIRERLERGHVDSVAAGE